MNDGWADLEVKYLSLYPHAVRVVYEGEIYLCRSLGVAMDMKKHLPGSIIEQIERK